MLERLHADLAGVALPVEASTGCNGASFRN